jgi:hypothetical protein
MDFFNSLSQVAKNKNNFNKWEQNQKKEEAQRKALYNKRQYSDEEIANAKALGKNIIDVVDIMDNHSESVSENVETAIQPIVAGVPFLTAFGSFATYLKFIEKPMNKAIYTVEDTLASNEEAIKLCDEITEFNKKIGKKNPYFVPYYLTYENSIKKIKDPELKAKATKFYKQFNKDTAQFRRKKTFGKYAGIGAFLLSFVAANIYAAKLQVDSSKIARFQARKALEDPKAFVNYTPEQIEKAKQEIAQNPELKKKKRKEKLKTGMIPSIVNLFKDRKAYKNAIKNDTDDSKIVTRELTPEELIQAKKDKEVLQRTVRLINNEAEKYSENMEVAAEVLINGTPFLGAGVGLIVSTILNKTGVLNNIISKNINKNGSETTKQLYNEFKNLKEDAPGYHLKFKKFFKSYMDDIKNTPATNAGNKAIKSKRTPKDLLKIIKQAINGLSAHKWGRKGIIAGIGSMITGYAGLLIGLKLQKSAARAGRYTAKRELEKDPRNFIGYTEEDYNEVKDIKNTEKPKSKFKEYALFIPTVIKQYYAYENYKKGEFKENKLLQEQLQKQDVTEEQIRDAKNLQRKLFNTFEKVDNNSQMYSESMEAAIEIAQPFIAYGGILALLTPFLFIGNQIRKGKISGAKVLDKVTEFFSKSSQKLKSKWFKNYLSNVEKNIPYKVGGTNVKYKPAGTILNGIDLQKDSIFDIISKSFKNLQNSVTDLRKLPDEEQFNQLYKFKQSLKSYLMIKDKKMAEKFDDIMRDIINSNSDTRADMLDILLNPNNIKNMTKENYDRAYFKLKGIVEKSIGKDKINNLYSHIHNALKNIRIEDIETNINKLYENFPELKASIPSEKVEEALNTFKYFVNEKDQDMINCYMNEAVNLFLSQENLIKAINTIQSAHNKLKNIPEFVEKNPELNYMFTKLKSVEIPIDEGIIKELKNFNIEIKPETKALSISDALKLCNQVKNRIKTATIKDIYNNIPKELRNPQKALQSFKTSIEKLTDEEFAQRMENIGFSSMDKTTMLKILPKIEKILNNIPKEEMNKIWSTIVKEFNEHPDEFIQLVKSGKIGQIFVTPGLKKALAVAGISWTVFTLAITYAIEAWLADMQLKAGRLGVMKAMESLEDPRYYANIEPTSQNTQQDKTQTSNLLKKIKS